MRWRYFCLHYVPARLSLLRRMASYSVEERGSLYSASYRLFFKNSDGLPISPWQDIPLFANPERTVLNMVVEIPRWTTAKMEICTTEALNPIKQDIKKGNMRFVNNCFPYHGYIWNYGAFPQTWEDPGHQDARTGCKGDNDPLDVCEIGTKISKRGDVKQVKVLGTLALIDEGETDWKILAIDVNDEKAANINDIGDIETVMPGLLQATVNWFKIYKMPTGKPPNQFAFNSEPKDKAFAMGVIEETHSQWNDVLSGKSAKGTLNLTNTTLSGTDDHVQASDAVPIIQNSPPLGPAKPVPESVDDWWYVSVK